MRDFATIIADWRSEVHGKRSRRFEQGVDRRGKCSRLVRILTENIEFYVRNVDSELADAPEVARALAYKMVDGTLDTREFALACSGKCADEDCATALWGGVDASYFIRMEVPGTSRRPIKIGRSYSPNVRTAGHLTSSPYPLTLLASFPECLLPEVTLHAEFAEDRMRGEWFRPTRRLYQMVRQLQAISCPPSFRPENAAMEPRLGSQRVEFALSSDQPR